MTAPAVPEWVMGVVPSARMKTGVFGSKGYTLVLTNYRLIVAETTKELVSRHVKQEKAGAKAKGAGFFGQWGAQLSASHGFARRYFALAPETALAETPGNVAIWPAHVRELRVERRQRDIGDDDTFTKSYLRITIDTGDGEWHFDTDSEQPNAGEARALLAQVFGAAVR